MSSPMPTATVPAASADPIEQAHLEARARFDKVREAAGKLDILRSELDKLVTLNDSVTPDDVVKGAATLVSKGLPAKDLAVLLSSMPSGGEALKQWVLEQDSQTKQLEQQASVAMNQARHELGVQALHVMMKDHVQQQGQPSQASAAQQMPPPPSAASAPAPAGPAAINALSPTSPTVGSA